jgi:hypothetical protein
MSELSPEAAALLEAARRSHGPEERDRERVLTSLHLSLGIAVPLAATASIAQAASQTAGVLQSGVQASLPAQALAGQAVAAPAVVQAAAGKGALSLGAKLLTWKAGKILLATVALGSAVGVTAVQRATKVENDNTRERSSQAIARGRSVEARPGAREHRVDAQPGSGERAADDLTVRAAAAPVLEAATPEAPEPAQPALAAEPAAAVTAEPVREPRLDAPRVQTTSATRVGKGSSRHLARARTRHANSQVDAESLRANISKQPQAADVVAETREAAPVVPNAPPPSSETELIRKALTSLRDRDAASALSLLDEHAARYPSGAFTTERRGLHVLALCAAGRTQEGKSEQAAFLKQAGSAPIAARVRTACEQPK